MRHFLPFFDELLLVTLAGGLAGEAGFLALADPLAAAAGALAFASVAGGFLASLPPLPAAGLRGSAGLVLRKGAASLRYVQSNRSKSYRLSINV